MQHRRSDASSSARSELPPLAPRGQQPGTTSITQDTESSSVNNSSARPRLSHRSRAGCWTCRKRKVKCDEVHPRCGPCTRLNKDCDWEFRWKFDDVTLNTQHKHSNVSTSGNVVWDPQAPRASTSAGRSQSPKPDDLPFFADLTNDEDRERKAETKAPGTFNVIVNPESFSSLPEYGSSESCALPRRLSSRSTCNSIESRGSTEPLRSRPPTRTAGGDPNVVVLSIFEEAPATMANGPSFSAVDRRTSLPDTLKILDISANSRGSSMPSARRADSITQGLRDERLMVHYRGFISKRIFPITHNVLTERGLPEDPIVAQARDFPPLYHAICAISLLSLALKGQQQLLTEAFQHYHQAISSSISSPSELHTDRVLYLHFLLLVYDICYATQGSNSPRDSFNTNMWVHHIQHLIQIARHRGGKVAGALQAYILWYVLYLDKQACLAGNGSGEFVRAFLHQDITLPSWTQIAQAMSLTQALPNEDSSFHTAIFELNHRVCLLGSKLSELSFELRSEAAVQALRGPNGNQVLTARIQMVSRYQNELYTTWHQCCPPFLAQNPVYDHAQIPLFTRNLFRFSSMAFSSYVVYSNSSLYPGQLFHLNETQRRETEEHCARILAMGDQVVESQNYDQHQFVFAIFLAGFATNDNEMKARAMALMRLMEGTGISCNATRSRELLVTVCEEQRLRVMAGGRAEEVDWATTARVKGMGVVNFGL